MCSANYTYWHSPASGLNLTPDGAAAVNSMTYAAASGAPAGALVLDGATVLLAVFAVLLYLAVK